MGQKNSKGTVSIENADGRIRLRWRYQGNRYSFNLNEHTKINVLKAKKIALEIEHDILSGDFDFTLAKYKQEKNQVLQTKDISSPNIQHLVLASNPIELIEQTETIKSIVQHFEEWTRVYRQMDCEKNIDYHSVRSMLKKWGEILPTNIHLKLNAETFCAGTFNRRLAMLKDFVKWLVKAGIWQLNMLEDINPKRVKKLKQSKRQPFTETEIGKVLNAFKNNTFCPASSPFKHSHYYPFIYFIFKTGVRNAEAIGLRVSSIDFKAKTIAIKEVLARSLKGTSSVHRIRKETKNGKERILPLTPDLKKVLNSQIKGKYPDDLVFQSPTGRAIDDHNFQRRIFKVVLKQLAIEERDLYACRHTFGSRCIDAGITPVMTAFLMGNNPETALRNYTHQINIPTELPKI